MIKEKNRMFVVLCFFIFLSTAIFSIAFELMLTNPTFFQAHLFFRLFLVYVIESFFCISIGFCVSKIRVEKLNRFFYKRRFEKARKNIIKKNSFLIKNLKGIIMKSRKIILEKYVKIKIDKIYSLFNNVINKITSFKEKKENIKKAYPIKYKKNKAKRNKKFNKK